MAPGWHRAKNTDAAWEFIKCATGYDAQVSWARDTYAIPTFVAAANEPVLMADPNWKFFVEAMKVSQVSAFVAEYANWREQLAQRYEKIWLGELPVAQALTEAQTAVDKTMAENAK